MTSARQGGRTNRGVVARFRRRTLGRKIMGGSMVRTSLACPAFLLARRGFVDLDALSAACDASRLTYKEARSSSAPIMGLTATH